MMRRILLSTAFLLVLAASAPARAADLRVVLREIESAEGAVVVHLWGDAETFRDDDRALAMRSAPAVPGTVEFLFTDLEPGTYALIGYHDEDGDGEMDRFLGMVPTEGYAVSNNPSLSGPPRFDESAFALPPEGATVVLELRY